MATRRLHLEWLLVIGAILMPIEASAGFKFSNPAFEQASQFAKQYKDKTVKDAQDKKDASKNAAETAKANAEGKDAKDPGKAAADREAALKQIQAAKDKKDAEDKEKTLDKMENAIQRLEALDPGRGDTSQELQPSDASKSAPSERSPAESNTNSPDVFENMDAPADGASEASASERSSRNDSSSESGSADVQTAEDLRREMEAKPIPRQVADAPAAEKPAEIPEGVKPPEAVAKSDVETPKADAATPPSDSKDSEAAPSDPAAKKPDGIAKLGEDLGKLGDGLKSLLGGPTDPNKPQPPGSVAEAMRNLETNLIDPLTKTAEKVGSVVEAAFKPLVDSGMTKPFEAIGKAAYDQVATTADIADRAFNRYVSRSVDKMVGEPGVYNDLLSSMRWDAHGSGWAFNIGARSLQEANGVLALQNVAHDKAWAAMTPEQQAPYIKRAESELGSQKENWFKKLDPQKVQDNAKWYASFDQKKLSDPESMVKGYTEKARQTLGNGATSQQVQKAADHALLSDIKASNPQESPGYAQYAFDGVKSFKTGEPVVGGAPGGKPTTTMELNRVFLKDYAVQKYGYGLNTYDYGSPTPAKAASNSTAASPTGGTGGGMKTTATNGSSNVTTAPKVATAPAVNTAPRVSTAPKVVTAPPKVAAAPRVATATPKVAAAPKVATAPRVTAPSPRVAAAPKVATPPRVVAAAPRYVPATTYYTPRRSGGRIFRGRR